MGSRIKPNPNQRAELAAHLIAKLKFGSSSASPPRERFVLFAPPLVQAILEGRKTVTRRLAKPPGAQPTDPCPLGVAGDRLWVREKWGYRDEFLNRAARHKGPFVYAADGPPPGAKFLRWRPSLHMPRAACRIILNVTATRAERLSHITPVDAAAEGCPISQMSDPLDWFTAAWDRLYVQTGLSWASNPWVWVISFTVAKASADSAMDYA